MSLHFGEHRAAVFSRQVEVPQDQIRPRRIAVAALTAQELRAENDRRE